MSNSSQTTLTDYLRALRRSWWLILGVTLLAGLIGLAYVVVKTPSYKATATETVNDPGNALLTITGNGSPTSLPLQLASAHAPDVTRTPVLVAVKRDLKLPDSLDQVRSLVAVAVDPNAYTVNITATDSNKNQAADIANAFAQADARISMTEARATYASQAKRLLAKLKSSGFSHDPTAIGIATQRVSILQGLATTAQPVQISAGAQVPSSASSPKPFVDIGAALVIGLLLGVAIAYGRSVFDRRLRDASAVEEIFGYPVLARLRGDIFGHTGSKSDEERGLGLIDPIDSEGVRMLRENLRYMAVDRDLTTLVVTSAVPEEGKSSVAATLAMANAAAGNRTLLVDADLRKGVLAERFGIAESPGLSDYLAGRAEPGDVLQMVSEGTGAGNGQASPALVCITAGSPPPRPADLLSSERFGTFLQQVRKVYDQVIVDCPPLLPVADALEMVPQADCVLMCARLNRTTRDQARAAREALERLPDRPVGLVITDFKERDRGYYQGYYRYGGELLATPSDGSREREGASTTGA